MKIITKLDRFSAWVLFGGMLLYFISGYGMTKGIIDASFASKIHLDFLTYIILVAFIVHTSFAIHLAFIRWGIWGLWAKALLIAFFIVFLGSFIYIDRYYEIKDASEFSESASNTNINTNSEPGLSNSTTNSEPAEQEKTFTLTELSKYDGQNGNAAYVAVDGEVYDLTSVFANGKHYTHFAGKDLTGAFYSRHAKSVMARYPIVGTLTNGNE